MDKAKQSLEQCHTEDTAKQTTQKTETDQINRTLHTKLKDTITEQQTKLKRQIYN